MTTTETVSPPLTLAFFGPMQILVQGRPLPHLRSRKTLWLLALLTLRHERPVEREWLAGTLWPDVDQSQAFANLRPILSDLRRALGSEGDRLQSPDRHTLLLELTGAEVDVLTFDNAIASGNLLALKQAVGLYRGPLLEGCLEEWVHQEREARAQDCLRALQKLGEAALTAGDYGTAGGYYQRAVSLDLWSDAVRRGLMEALAKNGDRNAALQVYREFLNVLRSDPTAVPDPLTSALYTRLRAEARQGAGTTIVAAVKEAVTPVVSGYLPHPLTELVGREDERLEVAATLRRSRLVTLTGPGGIGKTRLAIDVAAEIVLEYADGAWLVALEAIADGKLITSQIASVLGMKEEPGSPLLQSLMEHLRAKRLLLVLDNCEHLLEASAHIVGRLLRECSAVRILATSREALGITGEVVWAVPSLAVPDPKHLPQTRPTLLRVLMGYESVQLFVERAQAVQKTFLLTGGNAQAIARICAHLEGMPLAIELAAAKVQVMPVEQLATRLQDHIDLLSGGSRIAMSRQQTLRATLDWSHVLLNMPEQVVFRRLAIFAGGWSLEAAEHVCAACELESNGIQNPTPKIQNGEVLNLLTSLVSKSLALFAEPTGEEEGRYRFLEVVRQYAAEQFHASGEVELVRVRHRDWFLALAEEAEPHLKGPKREPWLRQLEVDHDNLRTVLTANWPGGHGTETYLRLASALGQFWDWRCDYSEGRTYLGRALVAEEAQAKTFARAKALYWAGALAHRQSDYVLARTLLEESLEIHRELEDKQGIADSLNDLGSGAFAQADYVLARDLYTVGLEIRRELGDKHDIANSLANLANVVRFHRDYDLARTLLEESLEIRRALGDRRKIADSLNNLGFLMGEQGNYILAQTLLEESLSIFQEVEARESMAWVLNGLVHVAYEQGDYAKARTLQEEGLRIFQEVGTRRGVAWALHNLGRVTQQQGDYGAARTFHAETLTLFREIGDRFGVAEALKGLGDALLAQHQVQKAVRLWAVADRLREILRLPSTSVEQQRHARQMAKAQAVMSEDAFAAAWEEGSDLDWEQAIPYALEKE